MPWLRGVSGLIARRLGRESHTGAAFQILKQMDRVDEAAESRSGLKDSVTHLLGLINLGREILSH